MLFRKQKVASDVSALQLIRSFRAMYRQLSLEQGAHPNLNKIRILSVHALVWMVLFEASYVAQPYLLKIFMDNLGKDRPFWFMQAVMVSIAGLDWVSSRLYNRMDHFRIWAEEINYYTILGYGHQHLMSLDTLYHTQNSTGEKENVLSRNMGKINNLVMSLVYEAMPAALRVAFVTIGIVLLGWQYTLIAAVTSTLYFILASRTERNYEQHRRDSYAEEKAFNRLGSEQINKWRTLQQFGIAHKHSNFYIGLLDTHANNEHVRMDSWLKDISPQVSVISLSLLVLLNVIYWQFGYGAISFGGVMVVLAWLTLIYNNLYNFTHFQAHKARGEEALNELVKMLQTKPRITSPQNAKQIENPSGEVRFEKVCFSYGEDNQHALKDVSFVIAPKTTAALVGPSGSGKSTIASLMLLDHLVSSGQITIDGVAMNELDIEWYRQSMVAVVSQDVELFEGSISDNIRLGKPNASDEEVVEAARAADIHRFVCTLQDGYNTSVGEDGVRLSGGQKQRIAIARALIKKPSLLILDEATSSLDSESQYEVQQSINQLMQSGDCSILVIAHRFSTIEQADIIVVLDQGQIVEVGTHEELERQNGLYKRLKDLEMRGGLA